MKLRFLAGIRNFQRIVNIFVLISTGLPSLLICCTINETLGKRDFFGSTQQNLAIFAIATLMSQVNTHCSSALI